MAIFRNEQLIYILLNSIQSMHQPMFQNQYHLRTNALCLNPDCCCFTRHCSVAFEGLTLTKFDKNHENCKKWLWNVGSHQLSKTIAYSKTLQKQDPDFLKEPLTSIQQLLTFSQANWKEDINQIFDSIKNQLEKKLKEVQERINQKIGTLIKRSQMIKKNILQLQAKCMNKVWAFQHQQFYRQKLLENLRQVQSTGLLKVINCQSLSFEVDKIKEHITRIQWYFWIQQSEIDRLQRMNSSKYEQQLQQLLQCKQIQAINKKLQDIQSHLKLKPFSFKDNNSGDNSKNQKVSLACGRCNLHIYPQPDPLKTKSKQSKRSECIIALYSHFCLSHSEEIIEKYIQKSSKPNLRTSLDQILRQVSTSKIKTCIVIDKQNFSSSKKQLVQSKDTYVIEVVSKSQQNIANGRYLIAQSSGKDAADILIILTLFELAKIDPKMRLILITNDHFGKTLQPIFSSLGAKIDLMTKVNNQLVLQINYQSEQMMIDQQ